MKNTPAGNWQKWTQIKIKYTYIVRTWSRGDKLFVDKMICLWDTWFFWKCCEPFSTLPEDAVTHFGITKEPFDKARISIVSCQNDGDKKYEKFYLLHCSLCVPVYLEKHEDKVPQNPKMEDFMTHFDESIIFDKSISDVQD